MKWNKELRRYENDVFKEFILPAVIGIIAGILLIVIGAGSILEGDRRDKCPSIRYNSR